jgi:hypothetical protein
MKLSIVYRLGSIFYVFQAQRNHSNRIAEILQQISHPDSGFVLTNPQGPVNPQRPAIHPGAINLQRPMECAGPVMEVKLHKEGKGEKFGGAQGMSGDQNQQQKKMKSREKNKALMKEFVNQ